MILLIAPIYAKALDLYWPTPNTNFLQGKPPATYLQPAASGKVISGQFGATRSDGRQFHEGVDLKPIKRNRRNEPTDAIYSVMPGKVVYVNRVGGNSSYGKYVVIEHTGEDIPYYSLYAHLSNLSEGIKAGRSIAGGTRIGTMGRTANHTIPKSRAHLHLEMGLRLTDNFEAWYKKENYKQRNLHGLWNGYNLVGWDALDFYKQAKDKKTWQGVANFIRTMDTAFVLRVYRGGVPNFVKRYPDLVVGALPPANEIVAWDVAFTWYGIPHLWRPRAAWEVQRPSPKKDLEVLSYNAKVLKDGSKAAKTLYLNTQGNPIIGSRLQRELELLFSFSSKPRY